jgi:hypothetical protein
MVELHILPHQLRKDHLLIIRLIFNMQCMFLNFIHISFTPKRKKKQNKQTNTYCNFKTKRFNTCCAKQGWTKEIFNRNSQGWDIGTNIPGPPPNGDEDTDGTVKYCAFLAGTNRAQIQKSGSFRSCYNYQETYRKYNYTVLVNQEYICSTLAKSTVDITDQLLPGSTVIKISGYTKGQTILPLVGFNDDPTYGCGAGYAKAFQAAQFLWIQQNLKPGATALLVCGSVGIVLVVISFASACVNTTGRETAEQAYERYMQEINASQGGNNSGTQSRPMTQRFDQVNPAVPLAVAIAEPGNRMSVNSSYSQKSQQQPQHIAAYMDNRSHGGGASGGGGVMFNVDDKI